jgi:flagellar biogenesis protein FliO
MNSTLRLLWALPLVLAVGATAMFVLRRFVVPVPGTRSAHRLVARESIALSNETRVHLVEVDGVRCLIVESAQNAVQTLTVQAAASGEAPASLRPAWFRRLSAITR